MASRKRPHQIPFVVFRGRDLYLLWFPTTTTGQAAPALIVVLVNLVMLVMMKRLFPLLFVSCCLFACVEEDVAPENTKVAVSSVSLDRTSVTLKEGTAITLIATVIPEDAENKVVEWTSLDEKVATVNDVGSVLAIKEGVTVVKVTTKDGGKTASCTVTVEPNLAPSVTVDATGVSAISAVLKGKANLGKTVASDLMVGFQYSKSAGILPSNSVSVEAMDADSDYNYSTGITGLDPSTTYYFRSFVRQNGKDIYGETKSFTTKDITSLLETKDASDIEATTAKLNAKLDLTDVQYSSIKYGFYWSASETTQNVFLKGSEVEDNAFEFVLTALSHKTQYWYKAFLQLDNQAFYGELETFTTDVVHVESVSLDKSEHTFNTIGNTLTLKATVLPADATDKSIEWTSSDENVAMVDQNGNVKAIGNGTATITVTAIDQGKTATCEVTVAQWVTSIWLDKTSILLYEGQEQLLTATVYPDNANDKKPKWTSSNDSVATVDQDGIVTAVSKGTATIKAEAKDDSGEYDSCSVIVKRLVASIELNKTSTIIHTGEIEDLKATVYPSDANTTSITWTSSDTSVATVSITGRVTGISRGNAIITATAQDGGGVYANCEVEVKQYVTSIELNKTGLSLNEGEEGILSVASILPENANDKSYTWISSNEGVAIVDTSGKVTAISKGKATIKAKANDGSEKYASCSVTVKRLVTSIELNQTSIVVYNGNTESLAITMIPSDASDTRVIWNSSNESVATVSTSGVVKGKSRGITTITVTALGGSKVQATCNVEVKQYVTKITLDKSSLYLVVGETSELSVVSVMPDNANDKSYTWMSSDEDVLMVDASGKVNAKKKGVATVKAKASDGSNIECSCSVTVFSAPEAVDLGLGVKWASFNLGASSPEEYGAYYAWGEIETKDNYNWENYKFGASSTGPFTKYNSTSDLVLETGPNGDDVASKKLGSNWRIPTRNEWIDLTSKCTWTWIIENGVNGYLVSAANGNSIFLPAAGYCDGTTIGLDASIKGYYWSSSLGSDSKASIVRINSGLKSRSSAYRYLGLSVRPVTE